MRTYRWPVALAWLMTHMRQFPRAQSSCPSQWVRWPWSYPFSSWTRTLRTTWYWEDHGSTACTPCPIHFISSLNSGEIYVVPGDPPDPMSHCPVKPGRRERANRRILPALNSEGLLQTPAIRTPSPPNTTKDSNTSTTGKSHQNRCPHRYRQDHHPPPMLLAHRSHRISHCHS